MMVRLEANGNTAEIEADGNTPLLYVLANDLGLGGIKYGCGAAHCGSCMVLLGDEAVPSCVTPLSAVAERPVTTLSGLAQDGVPGRMQRAFIEEQATQCGYCVSGIIIAAEALLRRNPQPSEAEIRAALDDNLCRCGAHNRMVRAVLRAAREA